MINVILSFITPFIVMGYTMRFTFILHSQFSIFNS